VCGNHVLIVDYLLGFWRHVVVGCVAGDSEEHFLTLRSPQGGHQFKIADGTPRPTVHGWS